VSVLLEFLQNSRVIPNTYEPRYDEGPKFYFINTLHWYLKNTTQLITWTRYTVESSDLQCVFKYLQQHVTVCVLQLLFHLFPFITSPINS